MKLLYKFLPLSVLFILAISWRLGAQDTTSVLPPIGDLTPDNIFSNLIDPLYTGLIVIFGYISYLIPGINKITPFLRVLAFALVAGLGFILFGGSFWKVAFSYFVATGLYDLFLKKIFPSPGKKVVLGSGT